MGRKEYPPRQRPDREVYVRTSVSYTDPFEIEVVAGLEYRRWTSDNLDMLRQVLTAMSQKAALTHLPTDEMAFDLEDRIRAAYPDRAYFIEVETRGENGWVQLFQPWWRP
jgi:hypothetical protein